MSKHLWKIAVVSLIATCGVVARLTGTSLSPPVAIAVFGGSVVAASFLLAWAAETVQVDVSASLATALLAVIAVLPEYAVDLYFSYTAGHRPEYGAYAAANMTGSNRLLIGIGWPLVALLFAVGMRRRKKRASGVTLPPQRRVELSFLAVASLYALSIPLKGSLHVVDAVVMLCLFGGYLFRTSQQKREEPDLRGLPAALAQLPTSVRRVAVAAMFLGAAATIGLSAKPFAEALIAGGRHLGIDEFLLVQWLAPLSSEAPELLVAGIFALRGHDDVALGTLLSSKVNQWTLLVGSLPLAYAVGGGGTSLALDPRQTEELLLTAAQSLFALAVLMRLRLGWGEAALLFVTFAAQLFFPQREVRLVFAAIYIALAALLFILRRETLRPTLGALLREPEQAAPTAP